MKKLYTCQNCSKSFIPGAGSIGVTCSRPCQREHDTKIKREKGELLRLENEKIYLLSPEHCKYCIGILEYSQRQNKFCSHSCSSSYNNKNRKIARKKFTTKD